MAHGGKRTGAGRKHSLKEPKKNFNVRILAEHAEVLKNHYKTGKLSKAIELSALEIIKQNENLCH